MKGARVSKFSAVGQLLSAFARNPTAPVIHAGLPSGGVAVFSYDSTGMLTAGETVPAGGGTCWAFVSADGQSLYVTNTGANTVGVYSLADPLRPARLQDFALRRPKQTGPGNATGAFQLSLDPFGRGGQVALVASRPISDRGWSSGGPRRREPLDLAARQRATGGPRLLRAPPRVKPRVIANVRRPIHEASRVVEHVRRGS